MRYGITLPISGVDGDVNRLVAFASLAEEVGWDGVFLEDYIILGSDDTSLVYDPWLTLAAIAMRTTHIRLGITVTPLARRRPWKVAREAITLDHLSHGRLIVGVGLGDARDRSFTHVSGEALDLKQRAQLLDESLDILAGLWSGQPFSYSGAHYHLDEITFLPRSVQQPRIPVWVGGMWPRKRPALRAARWDGYCAAKIDADGAYTRMTPDDVRQVKAFLEQHRTMTAPIDIVTEGETPGDDLEQARAQVRPFAEAGLTWWIEFAGTTFGDASAIGTRIAQGPPRIN